jgi:hypothetical protein
LAYDALIYSGFKLIPAEQPKDLATEIAIPSSLSSFLLGLWDTWPVNAKFYANRIGRTHDDLGAAFTSLHQFSCLSTLHSQVLSFIQTPLPSIHTVSKHFQTSSSIIEMSDTQGTPADTLFTERESKMLGWAMQSLKSGPPEVRT